MLEQTMQKRFDPRKPEDRQLTDERVSTLLNSVKQMAPSACVLLSIEHGIDDTLPLNMIEKAAEFMANKNVKENPVEEVTTLFITETQISKNQVKRIEQETREQHFNPLWRRQRIGRITASNFHTVHTKTESIIKSTNRSKKNPQYSPTVFNLINESESINHLPQIKWGVEHEKDGVKSFLSDIASQHDGCIEVFGSVDCMSNATIPILLLPQMACSPADVVVQLQSKSRVHIL